MTRSIFGWSYPPGAANDPYAPYNQSDPPCRVCGQWEGNCACPECPVCGSIGDPACYDGALLCSWCGVTTREQQKSCISCSTVPEPKRTFTDQPAHGLVRSPAAAPLSDHP